MKDEQEIVRAHDILEAVLLGELPIVLEGDGELVLRAATDTLCWVLGHAHNESFARNLKKIEELAAKRGYVLRSRTN